MIYLTRRNKLFVIYADLETNITTLKYMNKPNNSLRIKLALMLMQCMTDI